MRSLVQPLRALRKDRSYQFALLTALLISIYYGVDKMALSYLPPMAFRYISQVPALLMFSAFAIPFKRNAIRKEWTLNRNTIVVAGTI